MDKLLEFFRYVEKYGLTVNQDQVNKLIELVHGERPTVSACPPVVSYVREPANAVPAPCTSSKLVHFRKEDLVRVDGEDFLVNQLLVNGIRKLVCPLNLDSAEEHQTVTYTALAISRFIRYSERVEGNLYNSSSKREMLFTQKMCHGACVSANEVVRSDKLKTYILGKEKTDRFKKVKKPIVATVMGMEFTASVWRRGEKLASDILWSAGQLEDFLQDAMQEFDPGHIIWVRLLNKERDKRSVPPSPCREKKEVLGSENSCHVSGSSPDCEPKDDEKMAIEKQQKAEREAFHRSLDERIEREVGLVRTVQEAEKLVELLAQFCYDLQEYRLDKPTSVWLAADLGWNIAGLGSPGRYKRLDFAKVPREYQDLVETYVVKYEAARQIVEKYSLRLYPIQQRAFDRVEALRKAEKEGDKHACALVRSA